MGQVRRTGGGGYTAGPWLIHASNRVIVQADGAFNEIAVADGKVEGDDLPVSICLLRDPDDGFSEDETLANGFLIAAAPDFADIAARIQYRANELGGDYDDIPRGEVNAFLSELDEALTKARGEA